MTKLQRALFEPHKEKLHPAVMEDPAVREAFLSEMADMLMYYHDILLRLHVTAEEISEAYVKKHGIDMQRNYESEYKEKYHG